MFLDHPLIVLGSYSRQTLRQQVVAGVAGSHLHNFPLLAQRGNIFGEQQFHRPAR